MTGTLTFLIPFLTGLFFVLPGLFDPSMNSRLAIYPLIAAGVLWSGRRNVTGTHLLIGLWFALLPGLSLLWSASPVGGIPFAVRWFSFGVMVIGFSGSVNTRGLRPHLFGLATAAFITALAMMILGADLITGNPNRSGMILALGFTASLVFAEKHRWYALALSGVILAGAVVSGFITGLGACLLGGTVFCFHRKWKFDIRPLILLMLAGQIVFGILPETAGKFGPTLELRSRIWRHSIVLIKENLPLGTGTGSARLGVFTTAEPELRQLAGVGRRVDYLHSEPLTLVVENGVPGMILVGFLLYWLFRRRGAVPQTAMLAAFWPVFATDLPLATPLGALPAALFLALYPATGKNRFDVPPVVPALIGLASIWWGFMVITGSAALGGQHPSTEELELACDRIPWEERAFLAAGNAHLREGEVLSALEDSHRFVQLYPHYYRGWELRAVTLSAAGRPSRSAWARAAVLYPREEYSTDRYLFALNAVDTSGMDPDTAMAMVEILTTSRERMSEVVEMMAPGDLFSTSWKLLYLSETCIVTDVHTAARGWFMALGFAAEAGEAPPTELALAILRSAGLREHLDLDWEEKADFYLERIVPGAGSSDPPPGSVIE